jgi:glycosyltransferase involved in cell wall biosynthesis
VNSSSSAPRRAEQAGTAPSAPRLRVALVAGTLTPGGAEKQLTYMARALSQSDGAVQVYSLTRGEFYEAALRRLNLEPIWIGKRGSRLLRLGALVHALRAFRPHIIQSGHFYTNLYVALAARLVGALSIGSIRNDGLYEAEEMGRWTPWLVRLPRSIITNSQAAVDNLGSLGIPQATCYVVPNVIDLAEFDARMDEVSPMILPTESPVVATIALRLDPMKRLDRFLEVLSAARGAMPSLRGVIIGDGPERSRLEVVARERGLVPGGLEFLGLRDDIPVLLRQVDVFVLTSDHEGFPNVLLEAMAARLPVVTTPAGDAGRVVQDGVTGYVVAFDDVRGMAERVLRLAHSPSFRRRLGEAGRQRVEQSYSYAGLAGCLLDTYRAIAEQQQNGRALQILDPRAPPIIN